MLVTDHPAQPAAPATDSSAAVSTHYCDRRHLLKTLVAGVGLALATPLRASPTPPRLRIGYWPIAAGLPFFTAVERGFFDDAGVRVEAVRFASAPQIVEAMIAGRADGSANGTASAALAIGQLASPGLLQMIVANPSNAEHVLDQFIVKTDSPIQAISELKGRRVGSGPGIQNATLAREVLAANGVTDATVVELPIGQHVAAVASGDLAAAYTLEPAGTIGRLGGLTRVLESGVIARYVLGDPSAPWFGGAASLTSAFVSRYPDAAKRYVEAYARGVAFVREQPEAARAYLKGYTAIEGDLADHVPLSAYRIYNEFSESDLEYFQKFFDLFSRHGIFSDRVPVGAMMYRG